jgi:hypothetical protein
VHAVTAAELFEREQADGWAETAATIDHNNRLAARGYCHHGDTPKARTACGYCASQADALNTTGPLPVATPACLSCPAPAVCTFCPYEED